MIPQEKREAATRAVCEAFGVTEFEDIHRITKGNTPSLVYRIVVRGAPFLLKIINLNYDPTRHYACMKAAAEAGVAPRVWYTSVEDKTSITDFVEAAPLTMAEARVRVPAILSKLHALPPFPGVPHQINTTCMYLMHKGPALDAFLQRIQTGNLLPKSELEELLARYEEVAAVYPHHYPEFVSSHNDLFKPDNMVFDGNRLWLVDWEAAFLNDRYADLAVVGHLIVTNEAEEREYLQEYFGTEPDEYQRARFFLMQQLAHMFYTLGFLLLGSAGKPVDWSEPGPDFCDFQRRMWAGGVNVGESQTKILYGKAHWQRLKQNIVQPRYQESLRIVADRAAYIRDASAAT